MKYFFLFFLLATHLAAAPIRHELEVGEGRLTYYLDFPNDIGSFPLMVILEGSFVEKVGPKSVLDLHRKLVQPVLDSGIGIVAMDKRGVDGDQIDVAFFHRFNTVSQRLSDHIRLIQRLKANPPANWNGQLVILGGSEGGPIAIKLAHESDPAACIVLVGCGDQTFAEYIWNAIQKIAPSEHRRFAMLPEDREAYNSQIEMMKEHPDPMRFWFGQSFLYWSDALDQSEHLEFLNLKCPVFVVSGSEDIECVSTDRLVAMAKKQQQDVSYLRIDGMGHDVLQPQWDVMRQVLGWLNSKL
jgi:pimeloyl-ACP methyl ester carboxylesterase